MELVLALRMQFSVILNLQLPERAQHAWPVIILALPPPLSVLFALVTLQFVPPQEQPLLHYVNQDSF